MRPQRELRRRQGAVPRAADGDPLRASRDARRARHRPARRRARDPRGARRHLARTRSRQVRYDGTCEDLFFYVERLIVEACGDDAAGRLHTARSRNDIDMTMYRMRQRRADAGADRARARAARACCSTLADRASRRRSSPRTRTRSRRSRRRSRTTCWRSSSSSSATRSRLRAAYATHEPQSARRVRDHRHRLSDRSRPHDASCSGSTAPTGNTYGSIATVDYLLESVSAAAVLLAGLGRVVQDLLLWCTQRVRLPAAGRRLRAGQQHHAAEAQPGRARARARDRAARRSGRRRRSS